MRRESSTSPAAVRRRTRSRSGCPRPGRAARARTAARSSSDWLRVAGRPRRRRRLSWARRCALRRPPPSAPRWTPRSRPSPSTTRRAPRRRAAAGAIARARAPAACAPFPKVGASGARSRCSRVPLRGAASARRGRARRVVGRSNAPSPPARSRSPSPPDRRPGPVSGEWSPPGRVHAAAAVPRCRAGPSATAAPALRYGTALAARSPSGTCAAADPRRRPGCPRARRRRAAADPPCDRRLPPSATGSPVSQ